MTNKEKALALINTFTTGDVNNAKIKAVEDINSSYQAI